MGAPGPMCRDAGDARLLAEALRRPAARRPPRAKRLRLGVVRRAVLGGRRPRDRRAVPERGRRIARGRHDRHRGAARGHRARAHRDGAAGCGSRTPRQRRRRPREIDAPDLSPIGRALSKYRSLMPAEALVRADAVRAMLRRRWSTRASRPTCWSGRRWRPPPRAIENPTVKLPSGHVPADYANVRHGGHREPDGGAGAVCARWASRAPGSRSAFT